MMLSPRLKIIADSIIGYETMADIGSDHAYLPIYLIKNNLIKEAVASDVNSGPVEISKDRLKSYKVADKISVRQGNGLAVIAPGETEVIVVAGMGGILIKDILDKDIEVAKSAKLLILQPMRDSDKVREWLLLHGFDIIDEELIKDMDRIYEVIWAKPGDVGREAKGLLLVGEIIISKKHPLASEYINRKIAELKKVIAALEEKDTENCRDRAKECKAMLDYYREVMQWVR